MGARHARASQRMKFTSSARRCQGAPARALKCATTAILAESDAWTRTNDMDAHFAKRLEKQAGELLTILQTQITGEMR